MTDICNYGSGMELKQNDFTFGGIAKGKIIIDVNLIKGAGLYKNVVLNGSLNLPFSGDISGWVKLEMFSQFDNNNTIGAYGKMFDHAAIGNVFYANGSRVMYAMDRTTDYFKFGDKIEYDGRYFVWLYSLVAWALPNAFIIKATVFSWYNDVNFLPVLGEQEVYRTGVLYSDILRVLQ